MDKKKIKDWLEEKSIKLGLTIIGTVLMALVAITSSKGEVKIYKQNDVVKYEGAEYRIINIEKRELDLYEDYYDYRVKIKITNTGKKDIEYDSHNYYIANKDGKDITKAGLAYDDGTYLESGTLKPGESVEGVVSWTVKKDAKDITISELLNHSSGLNSFSSSIISKRGTFSYSNYGYALLGKIIEKISKKSYHDYLDEKIFNDENQINIFF